MNVGQLMILFGLKLNKQSFEGAFAKLAALKALTSSITGVVDIARDLAHMAVEAAHAGTHTLGLSQALGMSTKSIQEWSYIAERAGSDVNQFTVGISMFERNLREFAAGRGSRRFKDAMHDIGMTSVDAKHALTGPDGVNGAIFKVADAYQKMGNTANRAAINTGLFGARARGMAQDLGQGSGILREQIQHIHDIGGIVDEEKLHGLKEFNNAIVDVKRSWNGLFQTIVGGLGPEFAKLLDKITKWVGENKDLITYTLTYAFKLMEIGFHIAFAMFRAFMDLWKGFTEGKVGPVILFSLMIAAVTILAALIWTVLMPAVFALGSAIFAAMLPLLPYTLIIAAIVAALILIIKHWDRIRDGAVIAWQKIKAAAKDFWDWFIGTVSKIGEGFAEFGRRIWQNMFPQWLKDTVNWAIEKVTWIIDKLKAVKAFFESSGSAEDAGGPVYNDTTDPTGEFHTLNKNKATANGPQVSVGSATGKSTSSMSSSVSIAPTTITINGVQGAGEAKSGIADVIDSRNRHAAAALGGVYD